MKEFVQRIAIGALFISVAGGAYWYGHTFSLPSFFNQWFSNQSEESSFQGTNLYKPEVLSSVSLHTLEDKEYEVYRQMLWDIVYQESPEIALAQLKELIREKKVRKDCNNLTYQIGLATYERWPILKEAITHADQLCGYGAFHGVLGAYFSQSANPVHEMKTVCNTFEEKRDEMECYHAVGHSIMERSLSDVAVSTVICDTFQDEPARSVCGLGIFHELFQPHEAHHDHGNGILHSHLIKEPSEALAICTKQTGPYIQPCYKLAPRTFLSKHPNGAQDVLNWCRTAGEITAVTACTRGAIGDIMQYIYRFDILENICLSGTNDQITPCISEIVFNKLSYTSPEAMSTLCNEAFSYEETRVICQSAIQSESRI